MVMAGWWEWPAQIASAKETFADQDSFQPLPEPRMHEFPLFAFPRGRSSPSACVHTPFPPTEYDDDVEEGEQECRGRRHRRRSHRHGGGGHKRRRRHRRSVSHDTIVPAVEHDDEFDLEDVWAEEEADWGEDYFGGDVFLADGRVSMRRKREELEREKFFANNGLFPL